MRGYRRRCVASPTRESNPAGAIRPEIDWRQPQRTLAFRYRPCIIRQRRSGRDVLAEPRLGCSTAPPVAAQPILRSHCPASAARSRPSHHVNSNPQCVAYLPRWPHGSASCACNSCKQPAIPENPFLGSAPAPSFSKIGSRCRRPAGRLTHGKSPILATNVTRRQRRCRHWEPPARPAHLEGVAGMWRFTAGTST